MLKILSNENTVLNRFIAQMRDVNIQKDAMRFRRNLERAGEVMAYEISKTLDYLPNMVETPLGEAEIQMSGEQIVICAVMRAGIPCQQGFLNYFDDAQCGFVAAYRKYGNDNTFTIKIESISCPDLTGKTLILVDPMIATGASVVMTYNALIEKCGKPRHTHIATVIGSEEGINYTKKHLHKLPITIWTGAVDEELTLKSYVIPGLGDAGDLAYGEK